MGDDNDGVARPQFVDQTLDPRGGDGIEPFAAGTNRKDHGVLLRDVLIAKAERDVRVVADTKNRIIFDRNER